MMYHGVLRKMRTENNIPVQYYLILEYGFINLNQALDKTLEISFLKYECLNCHLDKPIFRQGFCKSCFFATASDSRASNKAHFYS